MDKEIKQSLRDISVLKDSLKRTPKDWHPEIIDALRRISDHVKIYLEKTKDWIIVCPKCMGYVKLYGKTVRGKQRYSCLSRDCAGWQKPFVYARAKVGNNRLPDEKAKIVKQILLGGISIRWTVRLTGVSKQTVRRIERQLRLEGEKRVCPCGLDAKHQGWCSFRFRQSPARQSFMKRWRAHGRKKIG